MIGLGNSQTSCFVCCSRIGSTCRSWTTRRKYVIFARMVCCSTNAMQWCNITARSSSAMQFVDADKRDTVFEKQAKFASSRSPSLNRTSCEVVVASKAQHLVKGCHFTSTYLFVLSTLIHRTKTLVMWFTCFQTSVHSLKTLNCNLVLVYNMLTICEYILILLVILCIHLL